MTAPGTPHAPAPEVRETSSSSSTAWPCAASVVLPFAQRALVEERGWMSNDEFVEALSLAQVLPGPTSATWR